MTEERRHIIEDLYIQRGILDVPNNLHNLPDSLKKARFIEWQKKHDIIHLTNIMGKHGVNDFKVAPSGMGYITGNLCISIYFRQQDLVKARYIAKEALACYLEDKRKLKEHITDWNTKEVRDTYNLHKKEWIEASNNVRLQKRSLWEAELLYARFMEWYTATNDRIKELEILLSKQEK